jgi:probable O-glycosylation ligase (exosortase A-associated)
MSGLIFTYALTYGGAVVALFRPFVGLLIYICFGILKPEEMWYWSVPAGNYSRVVAIGLLVGWGLHGFGSWRFGDARVTVVCAIAFVLWAGLSAALSTNKDVGWRYVEGLAKIILPIVVGVTTIDSVRKLRIAAWAVILIQGYIAYELNLSYFQGYNRLWFAGYGTLDNNGEAIALDTCIGMAFFLGIHEDRWWKRVLAMGLCGLMIHAVLFSFSRGGMLGLIITGICVFLVMRKRAVHYGALIFVVIATATLAGPDVRQRFSTIFASKEQRDESAESRIDLWRSCFDVMVRNPVAGIGPDHWPLIAHEYGFSVGKQAHTTWLRVGAEMGAVGVALYAVFFWVCPLRLWVLTRRRSDVADPWMRNLACGVIASLVGFGVSAQFVSAELVEGPYYLVMIGAGVLKLDSLARAQNGPPAWPQPADVG